MDVAHNHYTWGGPTIQAEWALASLRLCIIAIFCFSEIRAQTAAYLGVTVHGDVIRAVVAAGTMRLCLRLYSDNVWLVYENRTCCSTNCVNYTGCQAWCDRWDRRYLIRRGCRIYCLQMG